MATTHRSELVDTVTNALMDEAYDGGMGPMSEVEFPRHVRRLAETALEAITEAQADHGPDAQRVHIEIMPRRCDACGQLGHNCPAGGRLLR